MNNVPTVPSRSEIEALVLNSKIYRKPNWDFQQWQFGFLGDSKALIQNNLERLIIDLFGQLNSKGYFILDLNYLLDNYTEDIICTVATFILSLVGKPIRIFNNLPFFWRRVGVNLTKDPNKSEGIGKSPLHMDFVNAENPPDFVCLFALRHDKGEGGHSIVSNFSGIENELSPADILELSKRQFTDGKVADLDNIGEDCNPFSVIDFEKAWKYRVSANLLKADLPKTSKLAVEHLFELLEKRKETFLLQRGHYLVLNQHMVAHGKEALGNIQTLLQENERRLLMHAFCRKENI